jgi:hypothetical protein
MAENTIILDLVIKETEGARTISELEAHVNALREKIRG